MQTNKFVTKKKNANKKHPMLSKRGDVIKKIVRQIIKRIILVYSKKHRGENILPTAKVTRDYEGITPHDNSLKLHSDWLAVTRYALLHH